MVDVALTNAWIYYDLANPSTGERKNNARADFFLSLANEMLRQDIDWAEKYKGMARQRKRSSGWTKRRSYNEDGTESDDKEDPPIDGMESVVDIIIPPPIRMTKSERKSADQVIK